MSALNSPRGQACVVNIDDIAVASSVIKALRSSSNSNRHYKQNAARDDHLVNDVNQFNRIINDRREEVQKSNLVEQQMNEALNSYIPPTRPMIIVQSPDERQESKRNFDVDSDSDEEPSHSPQYNAHETAQTQAANKHTSHSAAFAAPTKDNDFDSDLDDDPAETAELMRNFIAPSSNHTPTKNRAQSYKGTSSNTSSSIRYGAGGIRGIQHASLQRSVERSNGDDSISVISSATQYTTTSQYTSNTTSNASKLLNIKPGQAIRVKAPNKKSRSSASAINSNASTFG